MSKARIGLLLGLLIALPLTAAEPTPEPKPTQEELDKAFADFRETLQAAETEIQSKGMSLSTDEATNFWPVFKRYQSEQKAIIDAQIEAVRQYARDYETLTDEQAVAYVTSLLERDQKIHDLRVKYLAEYQKVLPADKAARVIHISRRLGLAGQAKLASVIPLVY